MKRCPSCEQSYDDEALSFCPADGTRLEVEKASSMNLQATIMAPPPPSPPPMSQSFTPESLSGYETNVSPPSPAFEPTPPSPPPIPTPSWEAMPTTSPPPQQQQFTAPPAPDEAKRPNPMVAYIIIGASILIAGFLLFVWLIGAIAGVGGIFHLLLILALLIGFIGIAVGVFLLVSKK